MPNNQSIPGSEAATMQADEHDNAEDQDELNLDSMIHQMVRDQLTEYHDEARQLQNEVGYSGRRPAHRR